MGMDYSCLCLKNAGDNFVISHTICIEANGNGKEEETANIKIDKIPVYLRVKVREGAECEFYYSTDGKNYSQVGNTFTAKRGRWIGAKVGIFATRDGIVSEAGVADFDWFRIE